MIIVSQDKKSVINFENVVMIDIYHIYYPNVEIHATFNNGEDFSLGVYDTESRAKEVLNEIINSTSIVKYEMPKE